MMPTGKNDGRGEVKNPEADGRLKENQGGSSGSRGSGSGGKSGGKSGGSSGGSRGGSGGSR
jgi:hypothetical protein